MVVNLSKTNQFMTGDYKSYELPLKSQVPDRFQHKPCYRQHCYRFIEGQESQVEQEVACSYISDFA